MSNHHSATTCCMVKPMTATDNADKLLQKAFSLLARGKSGPARIICRKLIEANNEDFNSHHLLGVLQLQEGELNGALQSLQHAVKLAKPGQQIDQAYSNLALVLQRLGREKEALTAIDQAISMKSTEHAYFANKGYIAEALGEWPVMEQAFVQALQLNAADSEYLLGLTVALRRQGHLLKAWELLRELASIERSFDIQREATLLEMMLENSEAALARVRCIDAESPQGGLIAQFADYLADEGEIDGARSLYRLALKHEPDNAAVQHMLDSLDRRERPRAGAPDEYVQALYDQYADKFETHLQHRLQYGAPGHIVATLIARGESHFSTVLDLGCGTGLMAAALVEKMTVDSLEGVDLSAKMLKIAESKEIYHHLHHASILPFLEQFDDDGCVEKGRRWQLICAADVLIYLGVLERWFDQMHRRLHPGGYLAFTIETGSTEPVSLLPNGRYQHSPHYIDDLAHQHGFIECSSQELVLRKEQGIDVAGHIYLFRYNPS